MNILMITRKVDNRDARAGFTYSWVKKIALALAARDPRSKLLVMCLELGATEGLPENVEIFSLGKEVGVNRIGRFIEFQKLARRLVPTADGIFCHMNPEYTINIFPYARLWRKKIVAWYAHGAVTWKLRLLEKMADAILTPSPESFRLASKKCIVTGHGIDTDLFTPAEPVLAAQGPRILTVGRISPAKDLASLIAGVELALRHGVKNLKLQIVGEPGLAKHQKYFVQLKQMVNQKNLEHTVEFVGGIPNSEVVRYYREADIFVNVSHTGSVDKAVLEAMACGCLIITSNPAFASIVPAECLLSSSDPQLIAQAIVYFSKLDQGEKQRFKKNLRATVVNHHNIDSLAQKIVGLFV